MLLKKFDFYTFQKVLKDICFPLDMFTHTCAGKRAHPRTSWATASTYSLSLAMQMWFYVCLQSSPHVCFNSIVIVCLRSRTFRNPFPLETFSLVFIFKLCRRFYPSYPRRRRFCIFFESVFPIQLASTLSLNILFVKRRKTNGAVKSKQSSFVFYDPFFIYRIPNP